MKMLLVNAVLFQCVWLVAVQGDNRAALLALVLYWLVHLRWFFKDRKQIRFAVAAALLGWLVDSVLANLGVIKFNGQIGLALNDLKLSLAPVWLLCIWLCFTPTLLISLSWLGGRPLLASLLGFLVVPFSYFGGALLSHSTLGLSLEATLLCIACVWAILLPALSSFAAIHKLTIGVLPRSGLDLTFQGKREKLQW